MRDRCSNLDLSNKQQIILLNFNSKLLLLYLEN